MKMGKFVTNERKTFDSNIKAERSEPFRAILRLTTVLRTVM